jgi:hypothetical protein
LQCIGRLSDHVVACEAMAAVVDQVKILEAVDCLEQGFQSFNRYFAPVEAETNGQLPAATVSAISDFFKTGLVTLRVMGFGESRSSSNDTRHVLRHRVTLSNLSSSGIPKKPLNAVKILL